MRLRDKNPVEKRLLVSLERAGRKHQVWKAVALQLNRPRRIRAEVAVAQLDQYAGSGMLLVPGRVLGTGEVTKPITVAAVGFSGTARTKIEQAGGKALSIPDLVTQNPQGKGIRIIG
ncbi:MAG: 50S ribosomal protein L18e [Candidatus Aenigmarchaeota archaeon]|nr:50S ribosomal protein L18e [Candidatus Aenigmarchaeota archaeon]